jgi:hypothetical protein
MYHLLTQVNILDLYGFVEEDLGLLFEFFGILGGKVVNGGAL